MHIDSVTIDHIAPVQAIDIGSAPRDFEVRGFSRKDDLKKPLLVSGTYKIGSGNSTQSYAVFAKQQSVLSQFISLDILNNHGKEDYTCLYRFKVHGRVPTLTRAERK